MLLSDAALGLKFMQGFKINNPLFKAFASCVTPVAIVGAFKRQLAVDSDLVVRAEMYEYFDTDKGSCTLPLKLIAGTFASDKGLHFNPWLDGAGPRFRVLMGGHTSHPQQDAEAASNPAVFFSDEYMLRHGAAPLVEAFSFIGLPKKGADSLAATLETLLKMSFRVSLYPSAIENSKNGRMDLTGAKQAALRGLQRAAVRGLADFANLIVAVSKTPLHEAKKPLSFAPKDCAMRIELATVEEALAPLDIEIKLDVALRRGLEQPIVPMPAGPPATIVTLADDPTSVGTAAAKTAADAASAWGSSNGSPGPSASQVHAPSSPMAPFNFGAYPMLMPPPPFMPPSLPTFPPIPPSYASSAIPHTQPPAVPPSGGKGSLAYTLTLQGGGVWATTPQGLRWCGAKSPNAKPYDITKACVAAVLPDGMNRDLYCSKGGDCKHTLAAGFTKVAKSVIPMAHELLTVKAEPNPAKKAKGARGGKGARGRGGRARGAVKHE